MQLSGCVGPSQTFAMLPFSMALEDVETEIETHKWGA
jgi:hypothetical protein